jgi:hypothetical protein
MTAHARSRTTEAVDEAQVEVIASSTEGAAELGRLLADLFNQQVQHNLELAAALGQTVAWREIIQVQGEFFSASLERWSRLNTGYLAAIQSSAASAENPVTQAP